MNMTLQMFHFSRFPFRDGKFTLLTLEDLFNWQVWTFPVTFPHTIPVVTLAGDPVADREAGHRSL